MLGFVHRAFKTNDFQCIVEVVVIMVEGITDISPILLHAVLGSNHLLPLPVRLTIW